LAKSGRQYYAADMTGLSSTTVMKSASEAIEFGEITQNKGYYAVQGHSRSPMSPIERLLTINTRIVLFRSYCRLRYCSNYGEKRSAYVLEPPLGACNVHCSS